MIKFIEAINTITNKKNKKRGFPLSLSSEITNRPDIIVWMVFLFESTTKIVVLLLHFKKYIILVVNHIDS